MQIMEFLFCLFIHLNQLFYIFTNYNSKQLIKKFADFVNTKLQNVNAYSNTFTHSFALSRFLRLRFGNTWIILVIVFSWESNINLK